MKLPISLLMCNKIVGGGEKAQFALIEQCSCLSAVVIPAV